MKFILRRLTGNPELLLKVFLYVARKVVASTENDMDDRLLEVIEKVLGVIDIENIHDEVDAFEIETIADIPAPGT